MKEKDLEKNCEIVKVSKNKEKKIDDLNEKILKHHSVLSSFKIVSSNNKYLSNNAERSMLILKLHTQLNMNNVFFATLEFFLKNLLYDESKICEAKKIFVKLETIKEDELFLEPKDINMEALSEIAEKCEIFFNNKLKNAYLNNEEKQTYIKSHNESILLNYMKRNKIKNKSELKMVLEAVKDFLRLLTIDKFTGSQVINLTALKRLLNVPNMTKFKKEIKEIPSVILDFNLINKKNLKIEVKAPYISSVSFKTQKKNVWLEYEIPESILNLLLNPSNYVTILPEETIKLKGKYSIRLYCFLKDYAYRGTVEITRKECEEFLMIPASSMNNKNTLITTIIEPTLAEILLHMSLEVDYQLIPDSGNFDKIRFQIKELNVNFKILDPNVIDVNNVGENLEDNKVIMERIENLKENEIIYKNWNKRIENKINKVYLEKGEKFLLDLLNRLEEEYAGENTLVGEANLILKKMNKEVSYKKLKRKIKISKMIENKNKSKKAKSNALLDLTQKSKNKKNDKKLNEDNLSGINLINLLLEKCIKDKREQVNGRYVISEDELYFLLKAENSYIERTYNRPVTDIEAKFITDSIYKVFVTEEGLMK